MKTCFTCKIEKDDSEFSKNKNRKDGLDCYCKSCNKITRDNNKEQRSLRRKELYQKNRESMLAYKAIYTNSHKKEKSEYDIIYRQKNKEKITQQKKDWETKNKNEPLFKIRRNLRRRVHHALKGESKSSHTFELIGCSAEYFKIHIESQFQIGMTWDNYGVKGWHIDHIVPCYKFDLADPAEQRKCFHYSNQRPLWAKDNLSRRKD